MKKGLLLIPVILLMTVGCAGYYSSSNLGYPPGGGNYNDPGGQMYSGGQRGYGQNEDTSYFYDRLSLYGNWIDLNPNGYVWTPRHTGYRFRPYSDGHWAWTEYGWTWIANQEWGDITYHYGRWGWDNDIGWFWVPGTVWGPAWVTWRSSDQYMGWAPLPPEFEFNAGMSFNSGSMDIPLNFWIFIQGSHFQDRNLNPYVLPFERNRTIVNYTSMRNNIYSRNDRIINEGIGVNDIRRITGRAVPTYALADAQQPGRTMVQGQKVQIFRPSIKQNQAAKPKVYLNTDQARQELSTARVFDPQGQQTINAEAAAVQRRQLEENRLLKLSQAQEIKNLQLKRTTEARQLRDINAKARVNQDYEVKISDLKKNHIVEVQQMTVRHLNDTEQVKKVKQARGGGKK
jgi:hypothetical protein